MRDPDELFERRLLPLSISSFNFFKISARDIEPATSASKVNATASTNQRRVHATAIVAAAVVVALAVVGWVVVGVTDDVVIVMELGFGNTKEANWISVSLYYSSLCLFCLCG